MSTAISKGGGEPKHFLLYAGRSSTIQVWDLAKETQQQDFPAGRKYTAPSVAVSPDGAWCVTGGNSEVHLWNLATGRELARFKGHTNSVHRVAISADGSRAFSGSPDRTVRVWDLKKPGTAVVVADPPRPPEVKPVVKPAPEGPELDLTPLPTRKVKSAFKFNPALPAPGLASAVVTKDLVGKTKVPTEPEWRIEQKFTAAEALAFHPNGKYFLYANPFGSICLADLKTGKTLREFKDLHKSARLGPGGFGGWQAGAVGSSGPHGLPVGPAHRQGRAALQRPHRYRQRRCPVGQWQAGLELAELGR